MGAGFKHQRRSSIIGYILDTYRIDTYIAFIFGYIGSIRNWNTIHRISYSGYRELGKDMICSELQIMFTHCPNVNKNLDTSRLNLQYYSQFKHEINKYLDLL